MATVAASLSQILIESLGNEHGYLSLQGPEQLLHVHGAPVTGLDTIREEWVPMASQYLVARLVYNSLARKNDEGFLLDMVDVCDVLASIQLR